jgi:hypothetical protein
VVTVAREMVMGRLVCRIEPRDTTALRRRGENGPRPLSNLISFFNFDFFKQVRIKLEEKLRDLRKIQNFAWR